MWRLTRAGSVRVTREVENSPGRAPDMNTVDTEVLGETRGSALMLSTSFSFLISSTYFWRALTVLRPARGISTTSART